MSGEAEAIARALRSGALEVTRLAEGSGVILHASSLRSRSLNPPAMLLLDALVAGARSDEALVERLAATYDIDQSTAHRDVEAFLAAVSSLV